jgi:hypothetical protein
MARFRFEEVDPVTGIISRWWVDDENDRVIEEKINPATQDIIDWNRTLANASAGQRWGDGKIFASVPLEVAQKHLGKAIADGDMDYVKKWLNDPDHRAFRRFDGNV